MTNFFKQFFFYVCFFCVAQAGPPASDNTLLIYTWVGQIDERIIRQFEKETGIKVKLDYYDSDEVLEAKLLTGKCGYDLVMPSVAPYFGRQVQMKVYEPLNKNLLSNWKNLDQKLLKLLEQVDAQNRYGMPFIWGTTGFAYNESTLKRVFGDEKVPLDSLAMIFDEQYIKRLMPYGVLLLDYPQDLFEEALCYKGIKPDYRDQNQINIAEGVVKKIRPYVKAFSSNVGRMIGDLVNGDAAFVQTWSGDAMKAQQAAREAKKPYRIGYVVPKEYSGIWCDLLAIPKNAPHVQNAHRFLNFMMRADVAAKNIEYTLVPMANRAALALLPKKLRENPFIYPGSDVFKNFRLHEVLPSTYERALTRAWTRIRIGR
jgi:putrescine transport system substrate-binding protein